MQNTFKPTFGFGANTSNPAPAATPSTMFNFGSTAAATATPAAQQQQQTNLFSGQKFGQTPTTGAALQFQPLGSTATKPMFGLQTAPVAVTAASNITAPTIGLGGSSILTASTQSMTTNQSFTFGNSNQNTSGVVAGAGAGAAAGTGTGTQTKSVTSTQNNENIVNPKANIVPPEIIAHFNEFKVFLKKQREIGSEIACGTIKPALDLQKDMNEIEKELIAADNDSKKVRKQIGLLKDHMIKLLRYVDLIQKQQTLIMELYDNPVHHYNVNFEGEYFTELLQEFEEKIIICKSQFDQIEQMIFKHYNSNKLTPEELTDCLHKVQEIFISVAGKLHVVHSNLQAQKRNFLELRRKMFNDSRNPFDKSKNVAGQTSWLRKVSKITPGPTPFSLLVQTHDIATGSNPPTNNF